MTELMDSLQVLTYRSQACAILSGALAPDLMSFKGGTPDMIAVYGWVWLVVQMR